MIGSEISRELDVGKVLGSGVGSVVLHGWIGKYSLLRRRRWGLGFMLEMYYHISN